MSPLTVQERSPEVHEQVFPPGDEVTVYPTIFESPSEPGAAQDTVAALFDAMALTPEGALGGSGRGIEVTTTELGPLREAVSACTENL